MTTATEIKERPILFSGAMVKAILEGRKTMTRRIVKPQPTGWTPEQEMDGITWAWCVNGDQDYSERIRCPYGQPGDRLWVRETHAFVPVTAYRASNVPYMVNPNDPSEAAIYRVGWELSKPATKWRSGRFMAKWASRITLQITDVRVERLRDITEEDALAEGIQASTMPPIPGTWYHALNGHMCQTARMAFSVLWDSINGNDNLPIGQGKDWESNPWVWVVSFQRIEGHAS